MLKIESNRKPKNRINLYGSKLLSMGYRNKKIMVRSRQFGVKVQLNLK